MKKPFSVLSLVALVCLLLGLSPTVTHANAAAPEPTTCSHASNQLAGRIVLDLNHDNWPQAGEGVPNLTVRLANIHSGATILATTTTDTEGCYRFSRSLLVTGQRHQVAWSGLNPNTSLIHDPDNGTTPGTPNYVFTAGTNQPAETDVVYRSNAVSPYITHCPFADGTGDIAGMVAIDANNNNRADAGEGIQGAIVTLAVSLPSQVVGEAVTDANGCYRISRTAPAAEGIQGCCNHLGDGSGGGTEGIQGCCNHLVDGSGGDAEGIQGCCNHLGDGSGGGAEGIQGCCNHRDGDSDDLMTTYMYVRVSLPAPFGEIAASYDPNGRQTANSYYTIFTYPNGTFETDFLYRDANPTAVSLSTLDVSTNESAWGMALAAGALLLGSVTVLFRRRSTPA